MKNRYLTLPQFTGVTRFPGEASLKLSRLPELKTEIWEFGKTSEMEITGKSAREERAGQTNNSENLQRDHLKISAGLSISKSGWGNPSDLGKDLR